MNMVPTPLRTVPAPLAGALLLVLGGFPLPPSATAAPDYAGTPPSAAAMPAPALALAEVYRAGKPLDGYWVSEKLDGVRGYWDGHRMLTRGGNLIHAPGWFTAGLPSRPLDGELWAGRGRFEEVVGTVRRQHPDEAAWRRVRYEVYDLPDSRADFTTRLAELERLLAAAGNPHAVLLRQRRVANREALTALLKQVTSAGGEGLMLRRDAAPYRPGRSADLLKLKPVQDAEARVIALLPGHGKYRGMLGALLVEDARGRRFRIGTGFSDAQRRNPPPVGSTITFRYRGRTGHGIPRFASFLRVWHDL